MSGTQPLKTELRTAGRYGLVGLVATLVHLLVAQAVLYFGTEPFSSNLMGFLVAFVIGLLGHYLFTFGRVGSLGRAFMRYGLIAVTGFLTNNLVLITLVARDWIRDDVALAVAILIIPAGTFLASRFWGFTAPRSGQ